jgi:ubiquitin-like domain-containing CTD phosphatase 1
MADGRQAPAAAAAAAPAPAERDSGAGSDARRGDDEDAEQKEDAGPTVSLVVKWKAASFDVRLPLSATVLALKHKLWELTQVSMDRQKITGLKHGGLGLPPDHLRLSEVGVRDGLKLLLVGNRSEEALVGRLCARLRACAFSMTDAALFFSSLHCSDLVSLAGEDVLNEDDVAYSAGESAAVAAREEHQRALAKHAAQLQINIMAPLRPGKKLLVLDLDYTILDLKSQVADYRLLKRPHTDAMLTAAYQYYDIVVWSQTNWRWVEIKLTELHLLFSPSFAISFVLDKSAMFKVTSAATKSDGSARRHYVKALQLIWNKFPDRFSARNTVHVDDLSRNFALNPQSGVKVSPYKNALVNARTDNEMLLLTRYLLCIAAVEDFTRLDHSRWRDVAAGRAPL